MSGAEARRINREMLMLEEANAPRIGASLSQSKARKLSMVDTKPHNFHLNVELCFCSEGEENQGEKGQDYLACPLHYDLQVEVFARVSCIKYWKLQFLNKRFSQLLKSGDIFRVRQERRLVKPYVFMVTSNDITRWIMFDKDFQSFQKLLKVPSDYWFLYGDKETICAGTQLIVVGRELEGIVVWRYELEMNKWFKGPAMITPRVMYGSASHGNDAFFAGGIKIDEDGIPEVVSSAEKFSANTKTWTVIHDMHKRRKFCSGCFLHGKFYVIGGRDENNENLTCGESYDEVTDSWKLIPEMVGDMTLNDLNSPPLIAVVNNNLYLLEPYSRELRVYDINKNVWKKLGIVPVRADSVGGWGVAFKSVGDRLLLIGARSSHSTNMTVYTCLPSTKVEQLIWERSNDSYRDYGIRFSSFIHNCCVMVV